MAEMALLITRDAIGLGAFAKGLTAKMDLEFVGLPVAARALEEEGLECRVVEEVDLLGLLDELGDRLSVVVANFQAVEGVGRQFHSWQAAMRKMDSLIVESVARLATRPDRYAVFGNPNEYDSALEAWGKKGFSMDFKVGLASRALAAVAEFHSSLGRYLEANAGERPDVTALSGFPKTLSGSWKREMVFTQGENAHQMAALYGDFFESFEILRGEALNFSEVGDFSAAVLLIGEFQKPAIGMVQFGDVLAVSNGDSAATAWERLDGEKVRRFDGGVVIVNVTVDGDLARKVAGLKSATVIAPNYGEDALEVFKEVEGVRLATSKEGLGSEVMQQFRSVAGGILVQDLDRASVNPFEWKTLTRAQPLVDRWSDLLFAVKVSRHMRSSCVLAAKDESVIAAARAELSQILAWQRLKELSASVDLKGTVVAFDEAIGEVEILREARALGVDTILHAGWGEGSERENELLQVADECGLVLVATGTGYRRC
ncbi:MAG: hypothetical protein AAGB46_06525 [Verrucomicrobiota bacterium]